MAGSHTGFQDRCPSADPNSASHTVVWEVNAQTMMVVAAIPEVNIPMGVDEENDMCSDMM